MSGLVLSLSVYTPPSPYSRVYELAASSELLPAPGDRVVMIPGPDHEGALYGEGMMGAVASRYWRRFNHGLTPVLLMQDMQIIAPGDQEYIRPSRGVWFSTDGDMHKLLTGAGWRLLD